MNDAGETSARRPDRSRPAARPERVLTLGFLAAILLGAVLLALPAASVTGRSIGPLNSLFTAVSAVCVTGLLAVDTGTAFTLLGQIVLLALIQLGGLGFMLLATRIMVMLGRRISLQSRLLIRDSMNSDSLKGLVRLSRVYLLTAFCIELTGAAVLSIRFVPVYGAGRGLWFSLFHAVSAFCNAGFDLFGGFSSLTGFRSDPLVLLTVSMLILLGGTGFAVLLELAQEREGWSALTLHTRIVLTVSGVLLAAGTAFYLCAEWGNPATLGAESGFGTKLLNAFFQSVTMRTAGFNSVDLEGLTDGSKLFSCLLMLVGASPASTGGGMKTTTVALLLLETMAVIRGRSDVNVGGRRIPTELLRRAQAVAAISIAIWITGAVAVALCERGHTSASDVLFETASAVATVGVSAAGSPNLTAASRIILIPMMFFGRVGPLTAAFALARRQSLAVNRVRYPEEKIMIG